MLRRNEARFQRAFFDFLVAGIEADRIFSVMKRLTQETLTYMALGGELLRFE
ncbi:hypothetical protein QFZ96_000809 [Paraburkholderia youngii]